jgi:hypothetical protein
MLTLTTMVMAQTEKYVTPKQDGAGLYKNKVREKYEQPISKLGPNDRLMVVEENKYSYRVQTADGTTGWIDRQLVAAAAKSKTYIFEGADVFGYLDNPTPVYIIDADDPNANPISLDRSFKDALRENVDKETIERQVQ